jgi:hypothetical protein
MTFFVPALMTLTVLKSIEERKMVRMQRWLSVGMTEGDDPEVLVVVDGADDPNSPCHRTASNG